MGSGLSSESRSKKTSHSLDKKVKKSTADYTTHNTRNVKPIQSQLNTCSGSLNHAVKNLRQCKTELMRGIASTERDPIEDHFHNAEHYLHVVVQSLQQAMKYIPKPEVISNAGIEVTRLHGEKTRSQGKHTRHTTKHDERYPKKPAEEKE